MLVRPTLRILSFLGASALAAACTSGTTDVMPEQDAMNAAAEFTRLADSLTAAGGDVGVASSYRALATLVRGEEQATSPVVITIDGAPAEFVATAREIDVERTGACVEPGSLCLMVPPLRSMIAWQRGNPRRVVQVTGTTPELWGATSDGSTIGVFVSLATLTYLDGAGGVFVGSDGVRSIADPVLSDAPCFTTALPRIPMTCRRGVFTVSFSGTVAPPPFPVTRNTAAGTHSLAMTAQPVAGARIVVPPFDAGGFPPGWLPPVGLRPTVLSSTISASVAASGVILTLLVTNPASAPAEVRFASGQQFDFRVRRQDGTHVWTWSADKLFAQALGFRTLAPGETVTYSAQWTPPLAGAYTALGTLTSMSHRAEATVGFVVP